MLKLALLASLISISNAHGEESIAGHAYSLPPAPGAPEAQASSASQDQSPSLPLFESASFEKYTNKEQLITGWDLGKLTFETEIFPASDKKDFDVAYDKKTKLFWGPGGANAEKYYKAPETFFTATKLCAELTPIGMWRLPTSLEILEAMAENRIDRVFKRMGEETYWTQVQITKDSTNVAKVNWKISQEINRIAVKISNLPNTEKAWFKCVSTGSKAR